jgi:hypothetical protein
MRRHSRPEPRVAVPQRLYQYVQGLSVADPSQDVCSVGGIRPCPQLTDPMLDAFRGESNKQVRCAVDHDPALVTESHEELVEYLIGCVGPLFR